jgi:CheY-like chemotaxis protein
VLGDEVKINQVINNFLNNAIKFTEKGHIKFSASQTISSEGTLTLKLKFIDTGIGIDQDSQKKIFTPFEQLDPSITRKYGGTGLGLSISKNIVDLMGGKVSVDSTLGVGTTFIIEIPLEISSQKIDQDNTIDSIDKFQNFNVLIVEDNEINLKILCKLLDKLKVKNTSAISGHVAIELCKKTDFDLILMDLQMPGIDGFETTLKIFELNKTHQPKLVAVSANMQIDEKDKCLNHGMLAFYQKPVTKESLIKILMNHIDD